MFFSCAGVMNGKHYNRAMRMHKLLYEALLRLQWRAFSNSKDGKSDAVRGALLNPQQAVARLLSAQQASAWLSLLM